MNVRDLHQTVDGIAMPGQEPKGVIPGLRDQSRERRVLIVALDDVIPAAVPAANVLVIAPALNSRLRQWLSDEDAARLRAEERVTAFVAWLENMGVRAKGQVGDADPLLAIADALPTFPADEIMVAAQPEGLNRFADELVSRAHNRFALPVSRTSEPLAKAA